MKQEWDWEPKGATLGSMRTKAEEATPRCRPKRWKGEQNKAVGTEHARLNTHGQKDKGGPGVEGDERGGLARRTQRAL